MGAMLHGSNNSILFLWDKIFILMQNIFIVPAMQHGRHATWPPCKTSIVSYLSHSDNSNQHAFFLDIIAVCYIFCHDFPNSIVNHRCYIYCITFF